MTEAELRCPECGAWLPYYCQQCIDADTVVCHKCRSTFQARSWWRELREVGAKGIVSQAHPLICPLCGAFAIRKISDLPLPEPELTIWECTECQGWGELEEEA